MNEAIILAGGLGTRLKGVISAIPKPMAEVDGIPFLHYLLKYIQQGGIDKVILSVGYKHEAIMNYFGNGFNGMEIDYAIEEEPLGTGGAIALALEKIKGEEALILNGDTLFDINIAKLFGFFQSNNATIAIALRNVEDVRRYGCVLTDASNRIVNYLEKEQAKGRGNINGGVYILNKKRFESYSFEKKFSFEKDFLEKYYKQEGMYALEFNNYFIDIGIPEDYYRAQDEFKKIAYR